MKGLDTNVLVRYLTEDDPRQAAAAVKEIEGTGKKDEKLDRPAPRPVRAGLGARKRLRRRKEGASGCLRTDSPDGAIRDPRERPRLAVPCRLPRRQGGFFGSPPGAVERGCGRVGHDNLRQSLERKSPVSRADGLMNHPNTPEPGRSCGIASRATAWYTYEPPVRLLGFPRDP